MASVINIYAANADDFDSEGLGVLRPLTAEYENKGIGGAILTLEHPYDAEGRWQMIQAGRIVRAEVPVRTVPEIQNGALIQTAEQWTVSATATKAQRRLWTKAGGKGKKKKVVPPNTVVTVIKQGTDSIKVKTSKYGTGWLSNDGVDVKIADVAYNTVQAVEAATPSVQVREQLFRLQQPKMQEQKITVEALPVAYDAAGILTDPHTVTPTTGVEAVDLILDKAYVDVGELEIYTDIGDSRTRFEKQDVNIIDALLNGDDSFVGRWGGDVLLDDWTITILRSAGVDRGFYASYGRNLTGVDSYEVDDDVTTAIVPIGETEDGKPLYLDGDKVMKAPNYSAFPVPHMAALKVSEAKVKQKKAGEEKVTPALARQRMRAAVQAEWDKGVNIPAITLKIDFAILGDSEEYKAFKALDQCHMYDTVHVWHPKVCGYVAMAVCECTWDVLRGRYTSMTLGTPSGTMGSAKVSAGNISGSITGRQIAWGTLDAGNLADDCIETRHIQAESINADALQADSVTTWVLAAVTAHINALTAQTITTDELYASYAHMFELVADKLTAQGIQTDRLAAAMAEITVLAAGTATFDRATVQHLVAEAMSLSYGVGGDVFIDNLRVAYAQMVSAAIGNLCIRASDGEYYQIDVGRDGTVTATPATVTDQEAQEGQTASGRTILDTDIVAENLSTTTLLATYALINQIDAARIDVDQLFAREAFIERLNTTMITSDTVVNILSRLQDADDLAEQLRLWFSFDSDEGLVIQRRDEDGLPASIWSTVTDEVGYHIRRADLMQAVFSAYRDRVRVQNLEIGDIVVKPSSAGGWVWTERR